MEKQKKNEKIKMNFENKLKEILKKDIRFIDEEDALNRNEIINCALKADKELIGLLIEDKKIREAFFDKIKDYWVFNINNFIDYIQDKNFLSNSYTKFKNKIGLNIDGKYMNERGDVSLVFQFKDCILEGGMTKEDQKRNEIFFNEILEKDEIDRLFDPKVLTNFKKYTAKGKEKFEDFSRDKNGTIKDNLIIKGNNLLALHSLKKQFAGKIKLIYIDPPYNTGHDSFGYNDNFNHSTWLTFMKNRLEMAREILSNEGSIFIQCDDNEHAYLKILSDEIFGRDNFINQISWLRSSSGKTTSKNLSNDVDYILWYSKTEKYTFKPTYKPLKDSTKAMYNADDKDGRGKYRTVPLQKTGGPGPLTTYDYVDNNGKVWKCPVKGWRMRQEKLKKLENERRLYLEGNTLREKAYWDERENEGKIANNLWDDIPNIQGSNKELLDFSGQKPERLIKRIIDTASEKGDIIMDFFSGTGTTGAVAMKMKRQIILIEQIDSHISKMIKRIEGVVKGDLIGISKEMGWKGGGEFIYCELLKYNQEAIEKIQSAKDTKQLLKIWGEMCDKYFLNYDVDIKKFNENKKDFEKLNLTQQKKIFIEMLNKNQLYVNLSEMNDFQFKVSKEDKKLNKKFYGSN